MDNNKLFLLKNKFLDQINDETTIEFLNCLINSNVFIVAQLIIPDEIKDKMEKNKESEMSYKTDKISFNPLLLSEENGDKVFPFFSKEEEITNIDIKSYGLISLPFSEIVNIFNNEKDISFVAIDPFTRGFKFTREDILNLDNDMKQNNEKE